MALAKSGSPDRPPRRGPRPALVVHTPRGDEVRCWKHGHLLGVLNENAQLIIKCGRDEFVVVEVRGRE